MRVRRFEMRWRDEEVKKRRGKTCIMEFKMVLA